MITPAHTVHAMSCPAITVGGPCTCGGLEKHESFDCMMIESKFEALLAALNELLEARKVGYREVTGRLDTMAECHAALESDGQENQHSIMEGFADTRNGIIALHAKVDDFGKHFAHELKQLTAAVQFFAQAALKRRRKGKK